MSLSGGLKKKLNPKNNFSPKKKGALPKIIVVLGPTSSGKTDLAIKLAQKFGGEIISADSRQVYRGLNLGTGKVTPEETEGVPHHLIDVASPRRLFTAADYQKLGRLAILKILGKNKTPIVCGGTGFYINALLYNYKLPPVALQKKLRQKLEKQATAELFKQLKELDPERAKKIDSKNKRRLIRALEIIFATGQPVPKIKKKKKYDILKIGLSPNPEKLRLKINQRIESRIKQGLIREVRELHRQGLSWNRMEELGLEYRYISRYLRNLINYQTMVDSLKKQNWQYAKRQLTWFFAKSKSASAEKIHWFDSGAGKNFQKIAKLCENFFQSSDSCA